jgi:CubicO group peptidase (beta-lactamase class C family)
MKPSASPRVLSKDSEAINPNLVALARRALDTGTRYAVLVLEDNKIVFEEYRNGGGEKTFFLSNSISKSMVALAVGEALCAGKIKSLDDPARNYHAALEGTAQGTSSIRNLLKMSSGADPSAFSDTTDGINWKDYGELASGQLTLTDYVRRNSRPKSNFGKQTKDGEIFQYSGRDTSALALVVEGATGMMFQEWFEQTVWAKAGAQSPGYWQLTKDNRPVAEAVMLATPADYLRIASYVMEEMGKTNNACLSNYLQEATTKQIQTERDNGTRAYGYQVWIRQTGMPLMSGHGGQFLAFDPTNKRAVLAFSQKSSYDSFMGFLDNWYTKK